MPDQRFPSSLVLFLVKGLVEERLVVTECMVVTTELSESIEKVAKCLSSGHYKLICYVVIGQLCWSLLESRCLESGHRYLHGVPVQKPASVLAVISSPSMKSRQC